MISAASSKSVTYETEIAVLQVQVSNLSEKVDDLKVELYEIHECIEKNNESTMAMLKEFKDSNAESHNSLSEKVSSLEKWRWMIMGAAIVLGAAGFQTVSMIFTGIG
jgi:lipid II:glycine glycyltransferase (peptidoglycan interpeptide bridge formation enzyme)